MAQTIIKTKRKHPLTSEIVNVYNISAFSYSQYIERSFYGYTKQRALSAFNKIVKESDKQWIEYLAK